VLRRGAGQPLRQEAIYAEFSKRLSVFFDPTDTDYQELVEGLYREVLRQLREKIAGVFPR
jgi:hypothetical protein